MPETLSSSSKFSETINQFSMYIIGSYETLEDLKTAHPTGVTGWAANVGDSLYKWEDSTASWEYAGTAVATADTVASGDETTLESAKSYTDTAIAAIPTDTEVVKDVSISDATLTVTKGDGTQTTTEINIPAEEIPEASQTQSGLMSSVDKAKLDGVEVGAQTNQNAFSKVFYGNGTIFADDPEDTLTLSGGDGITLYHGDSNPNKTIKVINTLKVNNVAPTNGNVNVDMIRPVELDASMFTNLNDCIDNNKFYACYKAEHGINNAPNQNPFVMKVYEYTEYGTNYIRQYYQDLKLGRTLVRYYDVFNNTWYSWEEMAAGRLSPTRKILVDLESEKQGYLTGLYDISPGVTGILPISHGGTGNSAGTVASATTATKLATARTINGVAFDGSADISIPVHSVPDYSAGVSIALNTQYTAETDGFLVGWLLYAQGGVFVRINGASFSACHDNTETAYIYLPLKKNDTYQVYLPVVDGVSTPEDAGVQFNVLFYPAR